MICGIFELQIIDCVYGTPKHACPSYTTVCIGTDNENGTTVDFVATFNIFDPYSKLYLSSDCDTVAGSLYVSYVNDGDATARKQLVTLVPLSKDYLRETMANGRPLHGKAIMEYSEHFTDAKNVLDVTYELLYNKGRGYIHRIMFSITIERLQHTQRVITSLEKARLCDL